MQTLKELKNGFKYLEISNATLNAKIAFQGAHIFEFKRQIADDILWLSPTSHFEKGVAIRGGIPICWPRFGTLDSLYLHMVLVERQCLNSLLLKR